MSMDNPQNGTEVPTATPTTGIDEFAMKHDNTRNEDPPMDVSNVPRPGIGPIGQFITEG